MDTNSLPLLQIGLKLRALPKRKEPVYLRPEGLAAHTAIIAQSGSGKSFMLGRFLEELVGKTKAKVLILDPNCDFARFDLVNHRRFAETDDTKPHRLESDTFEAFDRMWVANCMGTVDSNPLFRLFSRYQHVRSTGSEPPIDISLSWRAVPDGEKARLLQESNSTRVIIGHLTKNLKDHGLSEWQVTANSRNRDADSAGYAELLSQIQNLVNLSIWDITGSPIQTSIGGLATRLSPKVLCIDLASLEQQKQTLVAADVALNALWMARRSAWRDAISKPKELDSRVPVFVVIDEAHNLAPEHPMNDAAVGVNEILTRIAMEGRKYGIFLVLVTQRPSRLCSNLLSQCDNLCLMKMSNPADVQLVIERFGFMPPSLATRALEFSRGQMALCGEFVSDPVLAQVSPRRTEEGGRSLRDEAWLL